MNPSPPRHRLETLLVALLAAILSWPACHRDDASASGPRGRLILTGSSTVAPLANEIARRFESLHPRVRVDVQSGGSSRGIADTLAGMADIGMVSRALKAPELDQGLRQHPIAIDGICIVLHKENPVPTLRDEDVAAIYRGTADNWKELGGDDREIVVVHKAEGRATLEVFLAHYDIENADVEADVIAGENQHVIKTVAGNEGAIGYVSMGEVDRAERSGLPIRCLANDAAEATLDAVESGVYPVTRPLLLITHGSPTGLASRFIDFAGSDSIRELVRGHLFASPRR